MKYLLDFQQSIQLNDLQSLIKALYTAYLKIEFTKKFFATVHTLFFQDLKITDKNGVNVTLQKIGIKIRS